MQSDVIVIGAGVVGLSAALALQARGLAVTVLDREGPASGASAGNAGAFAFTDILPLASPGILKKAPKWLLDPLGRCRYRRAMRCRSRPGCCASGAPASPTAWRIRPQRRRR